MAEIESSGYSILDAGGRFRTEYAKQTGNGNDKLLMTVEPELKVATGEFSEVFFKPRIGLSLLGSYTQQSNDQFERSNWSKKYRFNDYAEAELRELYLTRKIDDGLVILGKQQVAWGAADGLRILDVVNPISLTNFIMDEPIDSRIPLWMANYQSTINDIDVQLLWIPDHTFNDYSAERNWYFLTSPKIVPGPPPSGVSVQQSAVERPGGNLIKDANYGVRLTKVIGGGDLTFNYLYHYDDDLIIRNHLVIGSNGPVVYVNPTYKRSHLIGGTFSFASGDFVYRGEYGLNSNRYILTKDPNSVDGVDSHRDFNYVLGVDWSGLKDTFVSMQFFQSILSGDSRYLVRDKVNSNVTLNASRNLINQTWRVEVLYIYSINDKDSALRSRIRYSQSDKTSCYFEYDRYDGTVNGLFGEFRQKDRVLVGVDQYF